MKSKIDIYLRRYKRYIRYGIQYFLYEKPKGLDFTMRDTHLLEESSGIMHGYSKTNEKHLNEIFRCMDIGMNDSLLDVGCGKGVVLREAAKYPFGKIAGIDIDANLIKIANQNFKILNLSDRIKCIDTDAVEFDEYSDYNTFFFFNPFGEKIFREVINKILKANGEKNQIKIIYHNPVYHKVIDETKRFIKVKEIYDSTKDYTTNIYILN